MKVLVIAPHADDETLGAVGTMARLAAAGDEVVVAVLTGRGPEPHPVLPPDFWETVRPEAVRALRILGVEEVLFGELPAAMLSEYPCHEANRTALELVDQVRPERLFLPFAYDIHRDHREVFQAFSVASRPVTDAGRGIREILAYETISSTHWQFAGVEPAFVPNTWIDVSDQLDRKLRALAEYRSQMRPAPQPRSVDAARALATWRGSQVGVSAAEAFVLVRRLE